MNINSILVSGLFNRFDHKLDFKAGEVIAIIHGPNGIGKTMILRIINSMFNMRFRELAALPFRGVTVSFNDKSEMKISIFLLVQALVRLKEMEEDGLVMLGEKEILVPEWGRPFIRNICMALDAHLWRIQAETQIFSSTV